jgi:hypothetical protein
MLYVFIRTNLAFPEQSIITVATHIKSNKIQFERNHHSLFLFKSTKKSSFCPSYTQSVIHLLFLFDEVLLLNRGT